MLLTGREKIYTSEKNIDADNIIRVLRKAYSTHCQNMREIDFLFNYEKGVQPLQRQKLIRPEIDISVTDNIANFVKEFKIGYMWGSPIMMVQRGNRDMHKSNPAVDDDGIAALNEMLKNGENIGYKDQCMAEFIEICGIGHRFVDIKTDFPDGDETDTFVDVHTLDSRYAFCVYYNGVGQKKVLGASFNKTASGKLCFTAFTEKSRYEIESWKVVGEAPNPLGMIPIVEYERAYDRTGCFERQISDMDNLNILVSDFANDVAQKTQEIWWGNDVDFPVDKNGEPQKPKSGQWLLTYSGGEGKNPKIQPMSSTFDSSSTLNAINYRWNRILQKCKVPMQSDSQGGGSTGVAMDMSSGWSATEVDALKEQQMIEKGKREELKLILKAISQVSDKVLPLTSPLRSVKSSDIDFHFNRRKNYDMAVKANTFATYVSHGIHGRHALKAIDAFEDVEQTWNDSKELVEKYQKGIFEGNSESAGDGKIMSDNSDQAVNSPIIGGMGSNSPKPQGTGGDD